MFVQWHTIRHFRRWSFLKSVRKFSVQSAADNNIDTVGMQSENSVVEVNRLMIQISDEPAHGAH